MSFVRPESLAIDDCDGYRNGKSRTRECESFNAASVGAFVPLAPINFLRSNNFDSAFTRTLRRPPSMSRCPKQHDPTECVKFGASAATVW